MPSTQLTTRNQYDILGKVISSADPKNYTTTFEFNDRFGSPDNEAQGNNQNPPELSGGWQTFAFATKVTNAYGTTNNNGNVLTQRILVNSLDVTQTYTYDEVNRLKTAEEKQTSTQAQIWKQAFTFDRYGNRNFDVANTTANVLGANPTISQSNNRFNSGQSYLYDLAGNVTAEPGNKSYTYDGENHQLSFTLTSATTNYSYDGDGKRVRKANPDGTTIVYVYNAMGQMLAEYTTGTASGTSGTSYITADHLGSTRVVTKADGTVRARYDFLPFGEEIAGTIGGRNNAGYVIDSTRQKFTGYERDSESGLDFAQARYCSSATGRFMSIDPLFSSGREINPQTWNRYSYSLNSPIRYVDPTGLFEWDTSLGGSAKTEDLEKGNKEQRKQAKLRKAFLQGLAKAREGAKNLSGEQLAKVNRALDAYGEIGEKNGVMIGIEPKVKNAAGEATPEFKMNSTGDKLTTKVNVNFDEKVLDSDLGTYAVTHEGSHVADAFDFGNNFSGLMSRLGPFDITQYDSEIKAFQTMSYLFEGNKINDDKYGVWNKKWAKLDEKTREANRMTASKNIIKSLYGLDDAHTGYRLSQTITR